MDREKGQIWSRNRKGWVDGGGSGDGGGGGEGWTGRTPKMVLSF